MGLGYSVPSAQRGDGREIAPEPRNSTAASSDSTINKTCQSKLKVTVPRGEEKASESVGSEFGPSPSIWPHSWPRLSKEVMRNNGHVRREDFVPKEEDAKGAWMNNEGKVAAFLPWFTDDPVAEAPLKVIIMLAECKNLLRLVSKLFKSLAEEGTMTIKWKGPEDNEEDQRLAKPNSLMPLLFNPERDRDGRLKDRLPHLKSIDCERLDTLMDLNGCPSGLEELNCDGCRLIQSLAPLAACTSLHKLDVYVTNVSSLIPLMGCAKLELLDIGNTGVTDISPLSACNNLKSIECEGLHALMDLNGCPSGLEELKCNACHLIQSLAPLAACTNLRKLNVWDTNVSSLIPLMGCVKLELLDINNTGVTDISPLSACTSLKALWMSCTQVSDLSPLSGLRQLRLVDIDETGVTDPSPLGSLLQLESLICEGTEISDLTPLSKCSELKVLSIGENHVKSLASLFQFKKLKYLHHGKLKDKTEEQTEGYIELLKELMPGLICFYENDRLFWDSLPGNHLFGMDGWDSF